DGRSQADEQARDALEGPAEKFARHLDDRSGSFASFLATSRDVCSSPDSGVIADVPKPLPGAKRRPSRPALFDHLVGDREQLVWNGEAERLRSLEVDGQLELGRHLDRQVSRSCASKDAIDVGRSSPVQIDAVDAIGDQTAARSEGTKRVNRRPSVASRQSNDQLTVGGGEGV